jgi:nucleotide-binding universal stress UspA family protein
MVKWFSRSLFADRYFSIHDLRFTIHAPTEVVMLKATDVLVPIDFSPTSVNAVRVAVGIAEPEGDVTILHVIDREFVEDAVAAGMGSSEEITARLRARAESNFDSALEGLETGGVAVERMVVVGSPFVEILKIARDLDLPMIVMGVRGRSTEAEELLFGSTAEKVLRGARIPVLCVPF